MLPVTLPPLSHVLAVVAHPDDESFGLGGVIASLVDAGTRVDVLCLTAGEASSLHADGETAEGLARVRAVELAEAAQRLGVATTTMLQHPDGALATRVPELVASVRSAVELGEPDGLLVFGIEGGVTGHPDHEAATAAALTVAHERGLPVLQWSLPASVAQTLNAELGGSFTGLPARDLPIVVTVDRARQRRAIAAHASQAVPGSVLWRRLELLGDTEHLRLTLPVPTPTTASPTTAEGTP